MSQTFPPARPRHHLVVSPRGVTCCRASKRIYETYTQPRESAPPRVGRRHAGRHTRAVGRRHRREGNERVEYNDVTRDVRLVRCNSIGCKVASATETVGHFRSHLASTSHPYHPRPSFGHVQLLDTSRKSGSVSEPR